MQKGEDSTAQRREHRGRLYRADGRRRNRLGTRRRRLKNISARASHCFALSFFLEYLNLLIDGGARGMPRL